jgi:XTP/dITP diphosphohydrolase
VNRFIVATKNHGKLVEIRKRLDGLDVEVVSLNEAAPNLVVIEDADSFAGNALKKARAVVGATGIPALADDSGLIVDALNGRPGIYSARYGAEDLDDEGRYKHLLSELEEVIPDKRTARFQAALAYLKPGGDPIIFEGIVEGKIATSPSGSHGFGYDPVFIPRGYEQTMAELGPNIKSKISHRARALNAFVSWFQIRI